MQWHDSTQKIDRTYSRFALLISISSCYFTDHFSQKLICRDKKKDFAPNHAAYYPFGVDVFLSQQKIDHIARFVKLPVISSCGKLPSILVVNVQVNISLSLSLQYILVKLFILGIYSCSASYLSVLSST